MEAAETKVLRGGGGGGGGDAGPPAGSGEREKDARDMLVRIQAGLSSGEGGAQLEGTKLVRELLSGGGDPKVREIVTRSILPKLVELLRADGSPQLHLEALLAVTTVAAGSAEHMELLVDLGFASPLLRLLKSPSPEVVEQAMWVLGTVCADSPELRGAVLGLGGVGQIVAALDRDEASMSLQRIGAWTLSNVCDAHMRPMQDVDAVLRLLARMLGTGDGQLLGHVCWAISHTCDGPTAHIQAVVKAGMCPRLVALLGHPDSHVVKPALRAIGNIVCAEEDRDYTQHIVDCGAVPALRLLVEHEDEDMQKEACWTLSNIAAGTVGQIQAVVDSGAIPPLVRIASDPASNAEVCNEACWVLLNATSCGSDQQVAQLVWMDCVKVLEDLLADPTMVMMALEGLERVLQVGESTSLGPPEEAGAPVHRGGLRLHTERGTFALNADRVQALKESRVAAVARKAARLWSHHFVTCALCEESFSKRAQGALWCPECKCIVCPRCDCSVYHLNYQSELWREATEEESAARLQKQANKRNKRARKRRKNKQKKALLKRLREARAAGDKAGEQEALGALEDLAGAGRGQGDGAGGKGEDEDEDEDEEDEDEGEEAGPPQRGGRAPPGQARARNGTHAPAPRLRRPAAPDADAERAPPGTEDGAGTPGGAARRRRVEGGSGRRPLQRRAAAPVQPGRAGSPEGDEAEQRENEDLVAYLEQTGSILALAALLDEQGTPTVAAR